MSGAGSRSTISSSDLTATQPRRQPDDTARLRAAARAHSDRSGRRTGWPPETRCSISAPMSGFRCITWLAVNRSCGSSTSCESASTKFAQTTRRRRSSLVSSSTRHRDRPHATAARDDEEIEVAVRARGSGARRCPTAPPSACTASRTSSGAARRAGAGTRGCALRAGAARRRDRRARPGRRTRRDSRRSSAAARSRRRWRESRGSDRIRSASGAAARASAGSRTATRR